MPNHSEPATNNSRPLLYHYTDAGGLVGVLNSKCLWFSHLQFMNDSEEWSYGVKMLAKVVEEFTDIPHLKGSVDVVSNYNGFADHYSFSLSENKDILSQWRGYCPKGGYSFSIDDWHLEQMRTKYDLIR